MFIGFPSIPIPDIPRASLPAEVKTGSSTSRSKVIVCVNNKCITEERSTTGSSYLKVTTAVKNDETQATVVNSMYEEVPLTIWNKIDYWLSEVRIFFRKHLTRG